MAGFGAKVKLTVDKSGKRSFNEQINSMVGQIKVSNKFTVLQKIWIVYAVKRRPC